MTATLTRGRRAATPGLTLDPTEASFLAVELAVYAKRLESELTNSPIEDGPTQFRIRLLKDLAKRCDELHAAPDFVEPPAYG